MAGLSEISSATEVMIMLERGAGDSLVFEADGVE